MRSDYKIDQESPRLGTAIFASPLSKLRKRETGAHPNLLRQIPRHSYSRLTKQRVDITLTPAWVGEALSVHGRGDDKASTAAFILENRRRTGPRRLIAGD